MEIFTENNFGTINFKPSESFLNFLSPNGEEILKIKSNGDIIFKGELVENNKAITDGLTEFLKGQKYL